MHLIRKISIGRDYKSDAMHYAVGQTVYGNNVIRTIIEEDTEFSIYIEKDGEVIPWKSFNKNMGIAVEYDIDY